MRDRNEIQLEKSLRFVGSLIERGPITAREAIERGQAAGLSAKTLHRTKDRLGIVSVKQGKEWVWIKPNAKP